MIRHSLVELFPQLADARITHRWGGVLGRAAGLVAVGAPRPGRPGWRRAGGYAGDGVAMTNLAGRTLADLITGEDTELTRLPLVGHRSPRFEPEPLRWIGVNTGLHLAAAIDERERRTGRPAGAARPGHDPADRALRRTTVTALAADPGTVARLTEEESRRLADEHPRCAAAHERARASMPGGVPMSWMAKWAGPLPADVVEAQGSRFTCADGIEHVDLCLGDTGAMTGHSPAPTVAAVPRAGGPRHHRRCCPPRTAPVVAEELTRRFGLPQWQFTLSATDANRHVLRYARHLTGRPRVLVMDYSYHGSVDEAFATLDPSGARACRAAATSARRSTRRVTTAVVQFNDVEGLERELRRGDVACVLAEPAMTNIGIVLPEPGYHEALRRLTRETGTLLVIDETHTLCAGPGRHDGRRRAWSPTSSRWARRSAAASRAVPSA